LLLQRDGVRACRYKIILAAATNDKRCVFTLAATVFTRGRSCPKRVREDRSDKACAKSNRTWRKPWAGDHFIARKSRYSRFCWDFRRNPYGTFDPLC